MAEVYPRNQPELEKQFENEADCRAYLEALRWPGGYRCPKCEGSECWRRKKGLIECLGCGYETSVIAGTVFQDTKLPIKTWFRAMWLMAGQKSGMSALTLQRDLGLGSYKTAWSMLHKMRLAMVRPGRERLSGSVEVDETYWGAGIGRIRLGRIPDTTRATLHQFIAESIEPGSTVITDGLNAYRQLEGYRHERLIQRREAPDVHLLPRVHRVVSLLKRWLLGTHQGAVSDAHLNAYLAEFTFRFNRRKSASRGKLFYRLAQQQFKSARPHFLISSNHKMWDHRSHVNSPIHY